MKKKILFIHGMFQNEKSWVDWKNYFEQEGYECIVKSWPFHEGEPADLRNNIPADLGTLRLKTVIDEFAALAQEAENPILIGHSVGGLIVQVLLNRGIGAAGVCIDSVAPNKMLAFDWSFFRNAASITNPLAGNDPFEMTADGFYKNFANTMTVHAAKDAWEATATHDSRNMLRDCLMEDGHVDLDIPHRPLLFIAGEKDEIIPPELNQKNADAYKDTSSITGFKEFPARGHFICGQPGWEEVADYIHKWLEINVIKAGAAHQESAVQ